MSYLRTGVKGCSKIRRVLAKSRLILDEMCRLYRKFASYLRHVLCKTRLIFPRINGPIVVLLPQKRFFERFCGILSSPFTVPNNRRTKKESLFWKGSSPGAIFPQKIASLRFQTSQQKRSKDSRLSSYLLIKNPSKRSGASPPRKLKSHSFWTVKMPSMIYTCQPENCPADCLFLIGCG